MTPAATTTMLTFLPPPTTSPLDPSQRARLLKSTRKLENLLGATPHVLESDSLTLNPPKTTSAAQYENPKGQDLYISPSAASSIASFADSLESHELLSTCRQLSQNGTKKTHGGWKSMHLRTLALRLRKVPSMPFLNDGTKQLSPSSSSSVGSALNSAKMPTLHPPVHTMEPPPSPLLAPEYDPGWPTAKVSQGKIRLKRMSKLIRTLGENIPPELVFCQKQVSQDQKSKNEPSSRSRSLRPIWSRDAVSLTESASTCLQACDQQSNVPLESADPQASVGRKRWHRSASIGSLLTRAAANTTKSTVAQKPASVPGLSRSATTIQCQDTSCGNRSGWDGEWSIKDSEKRAMALRNLKC